MIAASPERVYAFASDPDNLPPWAAGLTESPVVRDGDEVLTLRQLDLTDDEFERDAAAVEADLARFRELLE